MLQILIKTSQHVVLGYTPLSTLATYHRSITTLVKFTSSHEWISVQEEQHKQQHTIGIVGITEYAQKALGDIVYLELPAISQCFKKDDQVHVVESVKAVSHINTPVSGEITEINSKLIQHPSLINKSPMKEGWLFKIRLSHPEELDSLLSESDYQKLISSP
jgi:glycine cleavage system H protein